MALRMTLKWLPETLEFRVRVLNDNHPLPDYDYHAATFGMDKVAKAEAWWDAMATAQDMAKRLDITLPEDFGIQA